MASRAVVFSAESMGRLSCLLAISIENNLKAHQKEILYISLLIGYISLHLLRLLRLIYRGTVAAARPMEKRQMPRATSEPSPSPSYALPKDTFERQISKGIERI